MKQVMFKIIDLIKSIIIICLAAYPIFIYINYKCIKKIENDWITGIIVGFSLLLISCIYLITFLINILLFQNKFIDKSETYNKTLKNYALLLTIILIILPIVDGIIKH